MAKIQKVEEEMTISDIVRELQSHCLSERIAGFRLTIETHVKGEYVSTETYSLRQRKGQ